MHSPPQHTLHSQSAVPHLHPPATQGPVGGRLRNFWTQWKTRGAHPWVVGVLRWGYLIQFNAEPPLSRVPTVESGYQDPVMNQHLLQAVDSLLEKNAIEEVVLPHSEGFYSRLFLTPKSSGGWRPIIDLKPLNPMVTGSKMKQETVSQLRASLLPNQWAVSVDLADAFFHVPVHPASRKFLRFAVHGRIFQYTALPFGLKTAPWVFTIVMNQLQQMPEARNIQLHMYLDDWLVPTQSRSDGVTQAVQLTQLCSTLGLLVNPDKSELTPSQTFTHLGTLYDLRQYRMFMTPNSLGSLQEVASPFLSETALPARQWLRLIGLLNSQEKMVHLGRFRIRFIQWDLKQQWTPATDRLSQPVTVGADTRTAVRWWLTRHNTQGGTPIRCPDPTIQVQTDASTTGWGGHSDTRTFAGQWSRQDRQKHINALEMKAVVLTLQQLQPPTGSVILAHTDNTTVMSHINRQGGTRSLSLWTEAQALFHLADRNGWTLLSKHVPGRLNIVADQLSRRGQFLQTEWQLHQEAVDLLFHKWGTPNVDLFATRLNARLPVFVSPVQDPMAWETDALSISWENVDGYAFPPYRILPQVLHKFQRE